MAADTGVILLAVVGLGLVADVGNTGSLLTNAVRPAPGMVCANNSLALDTSRNGVVLTAWMGSPTAPGVLEDAGMTVADMVCVGPVGDSRNAGAGLGRGRDCVAAIPVIDTTHTHTHTHTHVCVSDEDKELASHPAAKL